MTTAKVGHRTDLKTLLRLQGRRCAYCYRKLWLEIDVVTRDHVVPKVDGGSDDDSNIVVACGFCNNKKGRLSVTDFKRFHGQWLRRRIEASVLEAIR